MLIPASALAMPLATPPCVPWSTLKLVPMVRIAWDYPVRAAQVPGYGIDGSYAVARNMYPLPRTVWISGISPAAFSLRRRRRT